MPWTEVQFGRYKGLTLPQILFKDPDWFFWAIENDQFKARKQKEEALELERKARAIRIPGTRIENKVVRYTVHATAGGLEDVTVVPSDSGAIEALHTVCENHFDLSMPRRVRSYDKTGGKIMLRRLKYYLFGKERARMSKKRCEGFFDDDSNFVLEETKSEVSSLEEFFK